MNKMFRIWNKSLQLLSSPNSRLYNSRNGDHLYTTDNLEAERAERAGYVKEPALGFIDPHFN